MVQIRRAVQRDADTIAKLAAAAATEEGGLSALDTDRIKAHAFGSTSLFEAWIAEERAGKGACGHAIITKSYDVRRGMPIIILCDLYIVPEHRRGGLAREMMSAVARRAMDLGARELTITTGVENAVAQRFFAAVGAKPQQAAVFVMSADGIQWLATEGL
jgi:GNAT superfamily N-acetyltransferase